jgi:DNA polymerase elongation subunit (family B)
LPFVPNISLDKVIVLDIETLCNVFIVNVIDYKTKHKRAYVIYDHKKYENEALELFKFLRWAEKEGYAFLTFNGISFDSQVLYFFYDWSCQKQDPLYELGNAYIVQEIYKKAQELIEGQDNGEFVDRVPEHKLPWPQIDLFKQLHLDRKRIGLKWIEFSTRFHTIQEMPISHDQSISVEQIDEILEYCWNDVYATLEFFEKVKFETELRLSLSEEYGINLVSSSEPSMGKAVFGKFLCERTGIAPKELKQMRTERKTIALKDVILPYIKFLTPELNTVLEDIKSQVVQTASDLKEISGFNYKFDLHGLEVVMGLGGIHSCVEPGIYKPADESEVMLDQDIVSMYPNICIKNKFRPEHLPESFNELYEELFIQRKAIPKKDPKNYVLKILLNSVYGLSSEVNSYLFDRKLTYSITINGQLMILMFVEALYKAIPNIKIIQKNTDGVTFIIKKEYLPILDKVNAWWEGVTKLSFETAEYKRMIIRDVNNYIAEYIDGKVKKKGAFDTEPPFYKNPSMLVVPKALEAYFINNISPEDFVKSEKITIFDFCCGYKGRRDFKLNLLQNFNYAELITEQQKVCRFIVSKDAENAGLLVKDYNDGRRISVVAKKLVQPLDVIKDDRLDPKLYNIDYQYYLAAINKIKNTIQPEAVQASLF